MSQSDIIQQTVLYVKDQLANAEWGHDWYHIERVWNIAKHIQEKEWGDVLTVELIALLHDIADYKFHDWDETIWWTVARNFLTSINVSEDIISHVELAVNNISFKWKAEKKDISKEFAIVQDADRLDAIWAIGIARAFNFWWHRWRPLYVPGEEPNLTMGKEEYMKKLGNTINHFYEKLLLIKDSIQTETGKQIAERRHQYMVDFLAEFKNEWEGIV